jgi:GT2 family glycosyltransferase
VTASIDLSVVVIPLIGHDVLAGCLDRLPLDAVECIVVLREAMRDASFWARRYPSVIFLEAASEPVPLRRQRGVAVATGNVVGLLEDTSWPDSGWCEAARSAFAEQPTVGAGGPVRILPTLPSRYQALAWCEYGSFAATRFQQSPENSSTRDAPIPALRVPGNNMAFRRVELIEALGQGQGFFEVPICERMLKQGGRIVCQPRMLVTYAACDPYNASLIARVNHGRLYAAAHVKGGNWVRRAGHVLKAILLPMVLTGRTIAAISRSDRRGAKLSVLFSVTLMQSAWALGEALGALFGAGKSMDSWR